MDVREIANQYYDAWRLRAGDMSDVPLAEDLAFTGPVASFDTADVPGDGAAGRRRGAHPSRCGSSSPPASWCVRSSTGRWHRSRG
jgi:hypothetical protein